MSYQALYRVWRPRKFEDLVGQSHITQTLQNSIVTNKFSHAYLFSGPRGTGKTSAAKIFAQTINCEQMPAKEPCNECAACRGILDGSISDVIEMDAASNTSVDDIRDIRDKVKYASSVVPYKVYIIDEVHMISQNAFNALLKTLEEPPKHVVFILATTEPHKIPLTVISRCQRFDFKSINNKVIVKRLQEIMDHEEVEITPDALEAVALNAEGGMRDALSILDQTISYTEDKVEIGDVLAVTGGVSQDVLTDMTAAMFDKDTKETLRLFDEIIQNGKDPGRFVFDYIYFLRDILFYKTTAELAAYLERAIVTDSFKDLAGKVDPAWIQAAMMEFTSCEQQIKWTNSPKVFVEITLLSVAGQSSTAGIQQPELDVESKVQPVQDVVNHDQINVLVNRIEQLEKQLQQLPQSRGEGNSPTPKPPERRATNRNKGRSYQIPYERIRDVLDHAEKAALQKAQNTWMNFLDQLKGANAPAHATIQNSKPAAASKDALVVAFKYEIHCSLFLEHKQMVESILANVLDKHVPIIAIPEGDWHTLRNEYIQGQGDTEKPKEDHEEPIVEEAKKLFGDETVEVYE